MATWETILERDAVSGDWGVYVNMNGYSYAAFTLPVDFAPYKYTIETSLVAAAKVTLLPENEAPIIRDNRPIFEVTISRIEKGDPLEEYIFFSIVAVDGSIQEAEQLSSDDLIICAYAGDEIYLTPDYTNSTVDFYIYLIEPVVRGATIDVYQNEDGTWQAIVEINGTEILNDDYPSEELAHQAAQTAIAAI